MRLNGQTALVTGSATGIGREIAKLFAREGAHIVGVDYDSAGNSETAAEVQSSGGVYHALTADISRSGEVSRAFSEAGPVDILINNAASSKGDGALAELSEESWDHVIDVCLKGVFLCTREALKQMIPRERGVIVNLSSVNALVGVNLSAYTAAKGGILSLTRLIAAHYGSCGIRANAICPGTILSESSELYYNQNPAIKDELAALYPAGKFGRVEDVAAAALYLACDESGFINGTTLMVDGGFSATRRLPAASPHLPR